MVFDVELAFLHSLLTTSESKMHSQFHTFSFFFLSLICFFFPFLSFLSCFFFETESLPELLLLLLLLLLLSLLELLELEVPTRFWRQRSRRDFRLRLNKKQQQKKTLSQSVSRCDFLNQTSEVEWKLKNPVYMSERLINLFLPRQWSR